MVTALAFIMTLVLSNARADVIPTEIATIVATGIGGTIPGLEFPKDQGFVVRERRDLVFLVLRGRYTPPGEGARLLVDSKKIQLKPDNTFAYLLNMTDSKQILEFTAVDSFGKIQTESIEVEFKNYESYFKQILLNSKKRLYITAGLGLSSVSYTQTNVNSVSQINLDFDLMARYNFKSLPLDISSTTSVTAATLNSNTATPMRFVNFDALIGYAFRFIEEPWRLSLLGGFYYLTTISSSTSIGYGDISGFRLYPVLRKKLRSGSQIMFFFKYSPIYGQDAENNDMAIGSYYYLDRGKKNPFFFKLEYHRLKLAIAGAQSGERHEASSNAINGGLGIVF
jgi:hypothetical protein